MFSHRGGDARRRPITTAQHRTAQPTTSDPNELLSFLAAEAKSGHRDALETLFTLTRGDVSRFIAVRVAPDWVEDLTQETFSRALRGLPNYAGRSTVRSWLFSVARHTVADRYRTRARSPRCEHSPPVEEMCAPLGEGRFDEYVALCSLLDALPYDRRRAFVLTRIEGFAYDEAAEILGVPVGTVRSRVARGRRGLASMLRESG